MNTNLENKIKEHAEELFGSEPLKGHRDRFAGKLAASEAEKVNGASRKKQVSLRIILGYIAIAAVFAGCIIMFYRKISPDQMSDSEPLSEVQDYYSMQLQDKIDDIEQLLQYVDEQDRPTLMTEINNLLHEAESDIQASEEINTEFIVMTYSSKIEALQHIYDLLSTNYITN